MPRGKGRRAQDGATALTSKYAKPPFLQPIEILPWQDPRSFRVATVFFLALGVLARSVRYLLCFPLWKDEAFLAVNYIDAGFLDLTGPLHPHQVAPILYLFGQLAVTKLLGFNEYTLRAVSFASGIGALFLFRFVASRLLRGTSFLLAVALFSVGYPLIRFSAEAKPYALDVFVALALLALVARCGTTSIRPSGCGRSPRSHRLLWVCPTPR